MVTDANGEPLPGVSILVEGTNQGTTTDVNGNYRLVVPEAGDALIFSYVGYRTERIAIENQSEINISLQEDINGRY